MHKSLKSRGASHTSLGGCGSKLRLAINSS
jgi:hypothetical protein